MTRAYFLDIQDPVRFEISKVDNVPPKVVSLEKAVEHRRFQNLPFMRTRSSSAGRRELSRHLP